MKRGVFSAAALLVALSGALLGQPVLTSISPTQTTAGAPGFTMTLNGSGFLATALVKVNFGYSVLTPLTSTGSQITVPINSELLGAPGTLNVSVTNHPLNGGPVTSGSRPFTINSVPVITTTSPLNAMTVGVAFSQTLAASLGTPPYGNWHVVEGVLPAGLSLNANTGVIGGIPTAAGSGMVQISVEDSAGVSSSTVFGWTVNSVPLTITTNSLPNATAGSAYSQAFAAIGGVSPYTWSVALGTLQPGLSLSAAGVLSGTPTQGGTSNFTVRVADAQGSIATKVFTLTVTVPPATLSITGLTDTVSPAQQPTFDVRLSAAYPLTITGTITLTFKQNAIYPSDDPAIQFSGGGRTLNFTIAAGQISAFPTTLPSIQTGTVAGQIDVTVISLFAGGQNITPANPPVRSMTIARTAPKINSVQVVKVGGGFNIVVTGYSTPRQVIQADFTFTPAAGAKLQTTPVTVIVESVFIIWYTGTTSPLYGSQFLYTQPFTVQGNVSDIASVSVTLAHSTGTSAAVSASF